MHKKIICLVLCLALMVAMCACAQGGEQTNIDTDSPKSTYNYLTGEKATEDDNVQRPIAIMINNAKVALPQAGIADADIIYEAVCESGVTRLMAVYSSLDKITTVGSVRSARDQFVQMMLPLNAIYIHIGSSNSAQRMLNFYTYQDIDGIYLGSTAFMFDDEMAKTKSNEHCWFTTKDLIQAGIDSKNIPTKNNFYPAFDFVDYNSQPREIDGDEAKSVYFEYSNYANVQFDYDETSGKYLKLAFGVPHLDANTNTQLAFDNVFIILTDIGVEAENGILPKYEMNMGTGYYFYGGKYEKVTWEKGEPENPLIIYNADGDILKVNVGKTYVGILNKSLENTILITDMANEVASVERVQ